MISDVLVEACEQIKQYLDDPVFAGAYSGTVRDEIVRVVDEMDRLRGVLDQPPTAASPRPEQG